MKKRSSILLTVAIVVSLPNSLFAWGKVGHGIVSEIAFTILDSNTKHAVQHYLGATTIEQAGVWMDEMRSDHAYDYMKPWHYVNIEKGGHYIATKDGNIINALNNAIRNLEHKNQLPDDSIKRNLLIIFHLVGDFHQPLHVGYAADKGGNDIKVTYLGKPANLHWVWDTEIIESEKITVDKCLLLLKNVNKKEYADLKNVSIENWIQQPRPLLDNVYGFTNGTIDQQYVEKNRDIVMKQLLVAGIRLAAVLNHVFNQQVAH